MSFVYDFLRNPHHPPTGCCSFKFSCFGFLLKKRLKKRLWAFFPKSRMDFSRPIFFVLVCVLKSYYFSHPIFFAEELTCWLALVGLMNIHIHFRTGVKPGTSSTVTWRLWSWESKGQPTPPMATVQPTRNCWKGGFGGWGLLDSHDMTDSTIQVVVSGRSCEQKVPHFHEWYPIKVSLFYSNCPPHFPICFFPLEQNLAKPQSESFSFVASWKNLKLVRE